MKNEIENQNIPGNSPWVSGLIFSILLIITFLAGWVAGPMISKWQSESGNSKTASAGDHAGHNHSATESADSEDQWYVCPMHPWVVQQGEGLCPICTMDLTPLDPARFSGEIAIDPTVVQNIGVRVEQTGKRKVSTSFTFPGIVENDEREITDVVARVNGWIEKVYVNESGIYVPKGRKLLDIYSPELESAQRELLILLENDSDPNADLVRAARQRLLNLNMSETEIEALVTERQIVHSIGIFAPASGYVIKKNVDAGQQVRAGIPVYQLTNLSRLWVKGTIYEHQLPFVEKGGIVTISQQYKSDVTIEGTIAYIYPEVDPATRQTEVRIEIRNKDLLFKPGMYVSLKYGGADSENNMAIAVPREAVIHTGEKTMVFISKGNGVFEPRDVEVGRDAAKGYVEIRDGLSVGEHVVVSGQFLLDSESRIRESLLKMVKGDLATEQRPALEIRNSGFDKTVAVENKATLKQLLVDYTNVHSALYRGNFEESKGYIDELESSFSDLSFAINPVDSLEAHISAASKAINRLKNSETLESARVAFAFAGDALNELFLRSGLPEGLQSEYMGVRCGMFPDTPNMGIWIQQVGDVQNPFYGKGSAMESCHSDQWAFPVSDKDSDATSSREKTVPVANNSVSAETNITLDDSLEHYMEIHSSLYNDDLGGATSAADQMGKSIPVAHQLSGELRNLAEQISSAESLDDARIAFAKLGDRLDTWFMANGLKGKFKGKLVTKHCGMYQGVPRNGVWLQIKGETKNPFFGKEHFMAACAPEEWDIPTDNQGGQQ